MCIRDRPEQPAARHGVTVEECSYALKSDNNATFIITISGMTINVHPYISSRHMSTQQKLLGFLYKTKCL